MTVEERRKRAIEWLEAIYKDYIIAAHNYRVFWEVNKMFDNPKLKALDNTFHAWMFDVYTDSTALAVRRQVEVGKDFKGKSRDIISLRALLEELAEFPEVVTREYYRSLGSRPEGMADDEFDKWVGVGVPQLVKATIEAEIQELDKVSEIIRRYVNRHIAHKGQKAAKDVPSHEDVTKCFKLIADLIGRYYLLMKSTSIRPGKVDPGDPLSAFFREPTEEEMIIIPTIMSDWKAVFRIAWEE